MNPIFINLPTPSFNRKLIWRHFDSPDNPDNLGYIRCKTCYARFPDSFRESEMIEHLKSHNNSWTRFFDCLESRLSHKYNHKRVLYDEKNQIWSCSMDCALMICLWSFAFLNPELSVYGILLIVGLQMTQRGTNWLLRNIKIIKLDPIRVILIDQFLTKNIAAGILC